MLAMEEELCDRLRRLRNLRVLTVRELADLSHVHYVTISRAENDREYQPHPSTIRKLAAALGVTPAYLQHGYEA